MNTLCFKHECEMPVFRVVDGYRIVRCPQCVEEAKLKIQEAIRQGAPGAYRRTPLFAGLK